MWTTQDCAKEESHVNDVIGVHFVQLSKTHNGTTS